MKILLDFLPIAVFFVAFKLFDIWVATGVAIAATVIQIAWLRWSTGKVEPMQWLSLGVIVLFGGATLPTLSRCLRPSAAAFEPTPRWIAVRSSAPGRTTSARR